MNIPSRDYMSLIYNLTQDWSRRHGGNIQEYKVRTTLDRDFVETEQVLTEFGICYSTNNYLLNNISSGWLLRRKLPLAMRFDHYFDDKEIYSIVSGNQFDGEVSFTNKGYNSGYIKIFVHSPYDIMDVARKDYVTREVITFHCMGVMVVADDEFQE